MMPLLTALAIGLLFGWSLERAGLGCGPKLAGQFYLSDLTVFKAFFTAILTAMLGAFWLNRLGLLDLNLVALPETFAAPQAIGGAIFGAGFLIAGLCPGTAWVAAFTGKLDGMVAVLGILAGVVLFNNSYPALEHFYQSTAWGAVRWPDLLGISQGLGVALVTFVALAAFAAAHRWENRAR